MNKVTKESIESRIKETTYHRLGEKTTICKITMVNGFEVLGESACVDPKDFDIMLGRKYSYEKAFEKLWVLEGYLLQDKLYEKVKNHLSEANELEMRGALLMASDRRNTAKSISKAIFQKPLIPEECNKVLSPGTSYETKVEQKACNCMDWEKSPQLKKMMFNRMFPFAPNFAFDIADGHIFVEGKSGNISDYVLGDEKSRKELFHKMFPKAPALAFDFAEGKAVPVSITSEELDLKKHEILKLSNILFGLPKKGSDLDIDKKPEVQDNDYHIRLTKQYRKDLDGTLQSIKCSRRQSKERSLAITKIQEAIMWLGMDLKDLGSANPYPTSYNPNTTTVEPTADGLKL